MHLEGMQSRTMLFSWILKNFLRVAGRNTKNQHMLSSGFQFLKLYLKIYLKALLVSDPQEFESAY